MPTEGSKGRRRWRVEGLEFRVMKTVLIVHYNTQKLTVAAIRSLLRTTPDCEVVIFDNSNVRPFERRAVEGLPVKVLDNTCGQIINFKRWLDTFPDKAPSPENDYASAKHCKSVDICFDLLPDGFVLMDSDVLVKQGITSFFDSSCAWVGTPKMHKSRYGIRVPRVQPFLCYINVPMLREHGVRYCNDQKMWSLSHRVPDMGYDTGCWFYEDCRTKGLSDREVDINDYILHLGHASWQDKEASAWLREHKALWQ